MKELIYMKQNKNWKLGRSMSMIFQWDLGQQGCKFRHQAYRWGKLMTAHKGSNQILK